MSTKDIIVFSKRDTFSRTAQEISKIAFGDRVDYFSGDFGSKFPDEVFEGKYKIILSFLSPWILPKPLLDSVEIALNWHPAPRDYPGVGCYNFALYEGAAEYGATCHYMAEKVDTGRIVDEKRFAIFANDSVETLKLRTMITMTAMFHDTVSRIACGWIPEPCGLSWSRPPLTRKDLNALTVVDAGMTADEVRRRIRATTYPGYPGASVVIGGETFIFPVPARPPLA